MNQDAQWYIQKNNLEDARIIFDLDEDLSNLERFHEVGYQLFDSDYMYSLMRAIEYFQYVKGQVKIQVEKAKKS